MKSKVLLGACSAVAALVGFAASGSNASANTYTYSGVSVPYGVTAVVTPPAENSYVGQIKLHGVAPTPFDAFVYCLDLYNNLAGSDTFNLTAVNAGNGATVPHASSTNTDLTLTAFQVQQIGALIYNGFNGLGTNQQQDVASAATQLAIWNVEYGSVTLTSGGTGIHGGSDLSAVNSTASTYLSNVSTAGSGWLNLAYDVTLYVPDNTNSQDLSFASVSTTSLITPLPGALPLFLSGLVGLGLIGRRKRRVSATVA